MAGGGGDLWLLSTVIGVVILGAAIAYAMIRNRRVSPQQHRVAEHGAERVYEQEERATKRGDN